LNNTVIRALFYKFPCNSILDFRFDWLFSSLTVTKFLNRCNDPCASGHGKPCCNHCGRIKWSFWAQCIQAGDCQ